jgi:hypothetical protein
MSPLRIIQGTRRDVRTTSCAIQGTYYYWWKDLGCSYVFNSILRPVFVLLLTSFYFLHIVM